MQTAQKSLTITINGALTITTASLPNGVQGTPYSQTLTATGGTGLEYVVAGVRFIADGPVTLGGRSDQRDTIGSGIDVHRAGEPTECRRRKNR